MNFEERDGATFAYNSLGICNVLVPKAGQAFLACGEIACPGLGDDLFPVQTNSVPLTV